MNSVFETSLEVAVKAHKGQVDKNGVAYILHPLRILRTTPTRSGRVG